VTSVLLTPAPAGKTPAEEVPVAIVAVGTDALGAHGNTSPHADGAAFVTETRRRADGTLTPGEPSAWMVVPVLAGLAVLILLGIHPPGELTNLITHAAAQLRGAGR
jgi:hypothetical protein